MDAEINQRCSGCEAAIAVEADDVRLTVDDAEDPDLGPGLCRISVIWSCPNCGSMGGHTWYASADELVHGEFTIWTGEEQGQDTCIVVGDDVDVVSEQNRGEVA